MSALASLTCKAFLEKQPPERQKRLIHLLPANEQAQLDASTFANREWINAPLQIDDGLDAVHPSWILPYLKTCAPQELDFLLASLKAHQSTSIKAQLHHLRPLPSLTRLGKTYLRNDLLQKIPDVENMVPLQALPESPFNPLASLSFRALVRLEFFLGLRDLSQYIRRIIEKTKLKNVEQVLSPSEWQMVQQFSLKKDPLAAGRSGFDVWDGQPEKLRPLIEQHGINRLAKALFNEYRSLVWYVTHIFDVSRASFFQKVCTESPSEATRALLQEQVLEALKNSPEG